MISPGTSLTLSMILASTLLVSLDSLKLNTEKLKLSFCIIFSCRNFLTNLTETSHKLLFCSVLMLRKGLLRQTLLNTNFIFFFFFAPSWMRPEGFEQSLIGWHCLLTELISLFVLVFYASFLQCSPIQFSYFHVRAFISRFPLSKVMDGTERTAQCCPFFS